MADNEYLAEYAGTGRAKCKAAGCKQLIAKDTVRLGKSHPSGFHDGLQTDWYHPKCLFKSFCNAKKNTKLPEEVDDIGGYLTLKKEDKTEISQYFDEWKNGSLKKEVLEEKKATREEKKKEKALLDKVLGEGSPQASPKKKPPPKSAGKGKGKFVDDLISEESEDEGPRAMPDRLPPRAPERAQPAPEKKSSPVKKILGSHASSLDSWFTPSPKNSQNNNSQHSSPKLKQPTYEKFFGSLQSKFFPFLSNLTGFEKFTLTEGRRSLDLFASSCLAENTSPAVVCIGLSPFHHPSIKYDSVTALTNLKASLFALTDEMTPEAPAPLKRTGSKTSGSGSLRNSAEKPAPISTSESRFNLDEWVNKMRRKERFLFLHATTCAIDASFDAMWAPLLLKLIKLLMTNESDGVIFALFGTEAQKFRAPILEYYKTLVTQTNMRVLCFSDLSKKPTLDAEPELFNLQIDAAAAEMGMPAINWHLKSEYMYVLEGTIERHTVRHVLRQSANIGRATFPQAAINDKRISRDQVKVQIPSVASLAHGIEVTVLGRNPIEVQRASDERKVISQGETVTVKPGESFNLILGGDFLLLSLVDKESGEKIAGEDSSQKSRAGAKRSLVEEMDTETQAYFPTEKTSFKVEPKLSVSDSFLARPSYSPTTSTVASSTITKPKLETKATATKSRLVTSISKPTLKKEETKATKKRKNAADSDDEPEASDNENEDEAFARKLQREFEAENERYKLEKKKSDVMVKSAKGRSRKKVKYNDDWSEDDGKKVKGEIEDGGPDSPYSEDHAWENDKKFKYNSADEEISLSNSGEDSDDDDQIGKVVPCMYGAKCWRKNPDHLRQFSHPPR